MNFLTGLLGGAGDIVGVLLTPLVLVVLKISSFVTMLGGVLLNASVHFSVVKMSANMANLPAIDTAWTVIRDVANMGFIFVLLYTAIMTIFGQGDYRTVIKNVIIAAVLINFSLFFTKVIIDASNLLALTFYDAIAPGAATSNDFLKFGISNAFVEPMGITTLFKASGGSLGANFAITGILGSVVLLIAGFIFFAVAIMFIIRYVVLVFVLILSPIAFVADVLPGIKKYSSQWWNALIGQAFFAPIYFLLSWVTLLVIRGIVAANLVANGATVSDFSTSLAGAIKTTAAGTSFNYESGMIATFLNFAIIIAFLITSLIVAKEMSDKSVKGLGKVTNMLTGRAAGLTFGITNFAQRQTIGRLSNMAASNPNLVTAANRERTGLADKAAGAGARLALFASQKLASGTFDPRNMSVPLDMGLSETRLGKKLNLEAIIPRIGIGAAANNIAGTGTAETAGFKEKAAASEERVRDYDKAKAEATRKAELKIAIQEGVAEAEKKNSVPPQTFDQTKIDAMASVIKKMSDKELESQRASTLAIQEVAEALNQKQMDTIEKSTNFTTKEIQTIKDMRGKRLVDAFAAGTAAMPGVPVPPGGVAPTGYDFAMRKMKGMEFATLAKMSAHDPANPNKPSFNHPEVVDMYTPSLLGSLARQADFTQEKKEALRKAIEDRYANLVASGAAIPPSLQKSYNWLQPGSKGDDLYS